MPRLMFLARVGPARLSFGEETIDLPAHHAVELDPTRGFTDSWEPDPDRPLWPTGFAGGGTGAGVIADALANARRTQPLLVELIESVELDADTIGSLLSEVEHVQLDRDVVVVVRGDETAVATHADGETIGG